MSEGKDGCLSGCGPVFGFYGLVILAAALQGVIEWFGGFRVCLDAVCLGGKWALLGSLVLGGLACALFVGPGVALQDRRYHHNAESLTSEGIGWSGCGCVLLALAWLVARYWLRLPCGALAWRALVTLCEVDPRHVVWMGADLVGPALVWALAMRLPLSVFEPSWRLAGKTCGRCYQPVALDSGTGGKCPHCGALWSYESERRDYDPAGARRVFAGFAAVCAAIGIVVATVSYW